MTYRATDAIHRRHSPVQIVAPSDRMRLRPHNGVTFIAIAVRQWALFGSRDRLKHWSKARYEFMAEGALGIRRASSLSVPNSERRRMIRRSFGQSVIAWLLPCRYLGVTD